MAATRSGQAEVMLSMIILASKWGKLGESYGVQVCFIRACFLEFHCLEADQCCNRNLFPSWLLNISLLLLTIRTTSHLWWPITLCSRSLASKISQRSILIVTTGTSMTVPSHGITKFECRGSFVLLELVRNTRDTDGNWALTRMAIFRFSIFSSVYTRGL